MTEADWLTNNNAITMLQYLKGKTVATPRKLFLFTCASLRRLFLERPSVLALIEVAEHFVEGPVTNEERRSALTKFQTMQDFSSLKMMLVGHCLTASVVGYGADMAWFHYAMGAASCSQAEPEAARRCATLLREIFVTPLIRRVPRIPPTWRRHESTIFRLAQAVYDERAFDRLPILADAVEEAGGDNAKILDHLRCGDEHVRGCWVVDLVLGK